MGTILDGSVVGGLTPGIAGWRHQLRDELIFPHQNLWLFQESFRYFQDIPDSFFRTRFNQIQPDLESGTALRSETATARTRRMFLWVMLSCEAIGGFTSAPADFLFGWEFLTHSPWVMEIQNLHIVIAKKNSNMIRGSWYPDMQKYTILGHLAAFSSDPLPSDGRNDCRCPHFSGPLLDNFGRTNSYGS